MKDIVLNVAELSIKAGAARRDVVDLSLLRKIAVPEDGASFMVPRALYIFVASDRTADDGVSSVRPESIPVSEPGRYRRAALSFRQKA